MSKQTIRKSIHINAPPGAVWQVITVQPYLNEWLQKIAPGASAEGEVIEGGAVHFYLDVDRNGLKGHYTNVTPNKAYSLTFTANLKRGEEVEGNPHEPSLVGASEHYLISKLPTGTALEVENSLPSVKMVEEFTVLWDSALVKIKSLAEHL